jgi:hypothetical protein
LCSVIIIPRIQDNAHGVTLPRGHPPMHPYHNPAPLSKNLPAPVISKNLFPLRNRRLILRQYPLCSIPFHRPRPVDLTETVAWWSRGYASSAPFLLVPQLVQLLNELGKSLGSLVTNDEGVEVFPAGAAVFVEGGVLGSPAPAALAEDRPRGSTVINGLDRFSAQCQGGNFQYGYLRGRWG